MALFGFRSSSDDDYNEKILQTTKAELYRRVQDAKDEYERRPSASARNALMDAERQLKDL